MTRTERNITKRAIIRDRSESKSGLDKSDRKGGAGAHNWGALNDEKDLELLAREDNEDDADEEDISALVGAGQSLAPDGSLNEKRPAAADTTAGQVSNQQWQEARQFRATALKSGSDLGAIARTSAAASASSGRTPTATITTDATTENLP